MREPLNQTKSKKLRPLRIAITVLVVIVLILILDRLPTSVKDRTNPDDSETTSNNAPESSRYYYFSGFLDVIDEEIIARLKELGVPEEEYQNAVEYLTKDEIFRIEAKVALASDLESVYVEADEAGLKELTKIFSLKDDYDFGKYKVLDTAPAEYKVLSELLSAYYKTINTVEDYDVKE